MIKVEVLMLTARSATVQIEDESAVVYNDATYDLCLNGNLVSKTNKVINTFNDLKPSTLYRLDVKQDGKIIYFMSFETAEEFVTIDVKQVGAKGDGIQDDTKFIQAAIMACPKKGRVLISEGTYKISSLFLKSNLNLEIAKGATLSAYNDRASFPHFPGMIESYDEKSEYNLTSWEGNPLDCFTSIIHGIDCENVNIYGQGVINGNANFENWWHDVRTMITAFRPRSVFLSHCHHINIQGITIMNSPAWTIHPYFSNDLGFYDIKIRNPKDSHNTDGLDPESCENVKIYGADFDLGDDCIAVKSGKIYMAKKYHVPSKHILIRHCLMQNGHGAITVGSEIAAGVEDVQVERCRFVHTDRGLRIKTRRGRGKLSILKNIHFDNVIMDHVLTPFVANSFYFCDPDGKSDYVQCQDELPVDDRTPSIESLIFTNIKATNASYCAGYFTGLPEKKIGKIIMKDIEVSFDEKAEKGTAAMMCNLDDMCRKGFVFKNVEHVELENVKVEKQLGSEMIFENVDDIKGAK